MTVPSNRAEIQINVGALDLLMPFVCLVNETGHIDHIGPTLRRILGREADGHRFLELFEVRRPRNIDTLSQLVAQAPCRLRLRVRQSDVALIGQVIALRSGAVLVNLAFSVAALPTLDRFGLGAHDFPPTDATGNLLYLTEAKNAAMAEAERLTATLLRENAAALKQAVTDPLTGLLNRRGLEQGLELLMKETTPFSLMHLDLDFFKLVNDNFGHAEGDRMLLNVAEALRMELRGSDLMARMGGDEFVVVMRGLIDRRVIQKIAERIISRIESTGKTPDPKITLSASIGIAIVPITVDLVLERLHAEADSALYAAKAAGRRCVKFHSNQTERRALIAAEIVPSSKKSSSPPMGTP